MNLAGIFLGSFLAAIILMETLIEKYGDRELVIELG